MYFLNIQKGVRCFVTLNPRIPRPVKWYYERQYSFWDGVEQRAITLTLRVLVHYVSCITLFSTIHRCGGVDMGLSHVFRGCEIKCTLYTFYQHFTKSAYVDFLCGTHHEGLFFYSVVVRQWRPGNDKTQTHAHNRHTTYALYMYHLFCN